MGSRSNFTLEALARTGLGISQHSDWQEASPSFCLLLSSLNLFHRLKVNRVLPLHLQHVPQLGLVGELEGGLHDLGRVAADREETVHLSRLVLVSASRCSGKIETAVSIMVKNKLQSGPFWYFYLGQEFGYTTYSLKSHRHILQRGGEKLTKFESWE